VVSEAIGDFDFNCVELGVSGSDLASELGDDLGCGLFSRNDGVLACCGAGGRLRDGICTVGSALAKPRADLRGPGLADSCRSLEPSQKRQGAAAVRVVECALTPENTPAVGPETSDCAGSVHGEVGSP
jgi:hypothetical protein